MFMVLASSHNQIQSKITPKDKFVKGGRNVEVGMRNAEKKMSVEAGIRKKIG